MSCLKLTNTLLLGPWETDSCEVIYFVAVGIRFAIRRRVSQFVTIPAVFACVSFKGLWLFVLSLPACDIWCTLAIAITGWSFILYTMNRFFIRSFESSAARQICIRLAKSRFCSFNSSSLKCESNIPHIMWSCKSESWRVSILHVAAKICNSVMNFSKDSPSSWIRVKNLYLSTVSLFFGSHRLSKALIT